MARKPANWAGRRPVRWLEHLERGRAGLASGSESESTGGAASSPPASAGRVTVLKPRFERGWTRKLLGRWSLPPYRVHLDDVGSFIWRHCDGEHTVEQIGAELEASFGERVQPVEERLTRFIHQLVQGGMIGWKDEQDDKERGEW